MQKKLAENTKELKALQKDKVHLGKVSSAYHVVSALARASHFAADGSPVSLDLAKFAAEISSTRNMCDIQAVRDGVGRHTLALVRVAHLTS